jgi:hypothetical protein
MKTSKLLIGALAAGIIALAGCSKSDSKAPVISKGFDAQALIDSFADSPVEVHGVVDQAMLKIRYLQYPEAVALLDSLAQDSRLNDSQKKAVTNAIEQVKGVMASAPAADGTPTQNQ